MCNICVIRCIRSVATSRNIKLLSGLKNQLSAYHKNIFASCVRYYGRQRCMPLFGLKNNLSIARFVRFKQLSFYPDYGISLPRATS